MTRSRLWRPRGKVTPAGMLPRMKRFTVVGLFSLNMHEYDSGIALIHLQDAGKLLNMDEKISGLRLKLSDVEAAPQVRYQISNALPPGRYQSSRLDHGAR